MVSYCPGIEKKILEFIRQYDTFADVKILEDTEMDLQLRLNFSLEIYELYWNWGYDLFLFAVTNANTYLVPAVHHPTEITCSKLEKGISGYSRTFFFRGEEGKMSFVKNNTGLFHPLLKRK